MKWIDQMKWPTNGKCDWCHNIIDWCHKYVKIKVTPGVWSKSEKYRMCYDCWEKHYPKETKG